MNWGYKMMLVYLTFVTMMLVFVYNSFKVNIDLVEENYYNSEIKYQTKIEEIDNVNAKNVSFKIEETKDTLTAMFSEKNVLGSILFYKPNDAKKDFTREIQNGSVSVSKKKMGVGKWILKSNWKHNNTDFYQEKVFFVN